MNEYDKSLFKKHHNFDDDQLDEFVQMYEANEKFIEERQLWDNIHKLARTNEGLQELLEQCIMYYRLIEKKNGN